MKKKNKLQFNPLSFFFKGAFSFYKKEDLCAFWHRKSFSFFFSFILSLLAALLFASSFPGFVSTKGFSPAAWVCLLPLFFLVDRIASIWLPLWGVWVGVFSYLLFGFWLFAFHPFAGVLVLVGEGFYYLIVLLLLKSLLSYPLFQKKGFAPLGAGLVASLWVAYEWIKGVGFLAYPYGILGYSQYRFLPLLQSASLWGVLGISFCLVFVQAIFFFTLKCMVACSNDSLKKSVANQSSFNRKNLFVVWTPFLVTVLMVFLMVGIGQLQLLAHSKATLSGEETQLIELGANSADKKPEEKKATDRYFKESRIQGNLISIPATNTPFSFLLVQSNAGILPKEQWKGNRGRIDSSYRKSTNYEKDFLLLKQLTLAGVESAKKAGVDIDLVVWPETAFVPAIQWYSLYGGFHAPLVQALFSFQKEMGIPLLTGNSHGVKVRNSSCGQFRKDYNAAILLNQGNLVEIYGKQKLVPFSESYPFGDAFPRLKEFLTNQLDCSFWERGRWNRAFHLTINENKKEISWVPSICFEDGFGNHLRKRVNENEGVQLIFNLTNDSWAGSDASQRQHLAFSIFRAVENRLPVVRIAQSGMSGVILSNGMWLSELEPFTSQAKAVSLLIQQQEKGKTLYQRAGDFIGVIALFLSSGWFLSRLIRRKKREN